MDFIYLASQVLVDDVPLGATGDGLHAGVALKLLVAVQRLRRWSDTQTAFEGASAGGSLGGVVGQRRHTMTVSETSSGAPAGPLM